MRSKENRIVCAVIINSRDFIQQNYFQVNNYSCCSNPIVIYIYIHTHKRVYIAFPDHSCGTRQPGPCTQHKLLCGGLDGVVHTRYWHIISSFLLRAPKSLFELLFQLIFTPCIGITLFSVVAALLPFVRDVLNNYRVSSAPAAACFSFDFSQSLFSSDFDVIFYTNIYV